MKIFFGWELRVKFVFLIYFLLSGKLYGSKKSESRLFIFFLKATGGIAKKACSEKFTLKVQVFYNQNC